MIDESAVPPAAPSPPAPPSNAVPSAPGPKPTSDPVLPPELGRVSDGRRRRRTALAVLVAAGLAGAGGMYVGNRIQSPADRAAASEAPEPSLITVPVELRSLSSELVLAGQVAYNEPTPLQLAGSVGIAAGEAAVVTDIRQIGDVIQEGDPILEVTGRPVLALQGDVPMYRRLVFGSEGPDVGQLEQALVRLGYDTGSVDTVFDDATAAAVEQMYADAGYLAEGPSVEERDALVNAQEAVRQADDNLRAAQKAVADASRPLRESERLQLERNRQQARQAVPDARAAADTARVQADQSVATAQAALDAARIARDTAVTQRDQALQGAIDPDTGEPYSADRIAELQVAAAEAEEALVAADASLTTARTQGASSIEQADRAIADAQFQLQLVEAQYNETTAPGDVTALQEAVAAAQEAVDAANANLAALQAATGPRIPPGEIVFVPVLPSNLTESFVALGATVQGVLGTLATSDTLITARVSRVDSALVAVGAAVDVEIRGAGVTTSGTVLSVGAPAASSQPGGGESGAPQQGTGRLEVTIVPDDPETVRNYIFWDARIVVSVAATDGEVLVVPVAALTVGPDQVSQLEIERTPATETTPAVTEVVKVEVGLTASGLAEVRPLEPGALQEGDRVVIGVETGERQNEDDTEGPSVPSGDSVDDGGSDDQGDQGDSGDEGDNGDSSDSGDEGNSGDESASSPLAELLGYDFDPVEQRRLQLQIEEQTAECMRDLGYEYQPVDYQAMSNPEDELMFTDPKGFGEKYGYGIIRNYELYESGEAPPPDQGFVDPNQEYVNSLSPEEQTKYYEALYGAPVEASAAFEGGDAVAATAAPQSPEQMGCNGQAYAAVYGDNPADDPEIQEALGDYYTNIENDPRIDDANQLWVECMTTAFADRGIDPAPDDPNRMYEVVDRLKVEALGLEVVEVANQAEMDEYFNSGQPVYSATSDETGKGFVYLGEPEVLSGEEIDRLTGIEVELWKQDQACQEEAGVAEVRRTIELEAVDQLTSQFPELAG